MDGKPAPIYEAYGALRAVPAGRGAHRVEMRWSAQAGSVLSLAGAVGVLVLWYVRARRGERA